MKVIQLGTETLKGLNIHAGNSLNELASQDKEYDNFVDLYVDIMEHTPVTNSVLKKLVGIGVFDTFGSADELLYIIQLYEKYAKRSTIRKVEIADSPFSEEDVQKYAGKETAKQYSQMDMHGLLSSTVEKIRNTIPTPPINQVVNEAELVGVPLTTIIDPNASELEDRLALIYKVKFPRWAWGDAIINLFRLGSGDLEVMRVYKSALHNRTLEEGQIIITTSSKERKNYQGEIENVLVSWQEIVQ